MKVNNDAIMVGPCPVHGAKPEMHKIPLTGEREAYQLLCPVPGCDCYGDWAPTRTLAMEEWDAMTYALTGREETAVFPGLDFLSGDDDEADPFDVSELEDSEDD